MNQNEIITKHLKQATEGAYWLGVGLGFLLGVGMGIMIGLRIA